MWNAIKWPGVPPRPAQLLHEDISNHKLSLEEHFPATKEKMVT